MAASATVSREVLEASLGQVVLYHAEVTLFIKGSPILIDWFFVASGFLITTLLLDEFKKTGDIGLLKTRSASGAMVPLASGGLGRVG